MVIYALPITYLVIMKHCSHRHERSLYSCHNWFCLNGPLFGVCGFLSTAQYVIQHIKRGTPLRGVTWKDGTGLLPVRKSGHGFAVGRIWACALWGPNALWPTCSVGELSKGAAECVIGHARN
ncbi:hypothetical protein BDW22DRAFT_1364455, partial [Trametopsis cervina]